MEPFIIFGLGNPGREYEETRHNIGFIALDKLSIEWKIDMTRVRYKSLMGEGKFGDDRIYLVKPLTYMNNSGNAVRSFMRFYKLEPDRILVIHDDLDLPFGNIRMRESGGSSGQRGMQSIISKIGTDQFARLRIGIGRPPGNMDPVDYVLKKFSHNLESDLDLVLNNIVRSIEMLLTEGIEKAMTLYNHSVFQDE
ncbi:MAG: aminoacyl-tRNA hydrolase [Pelolinea sp.]|nr:aminoacyl-tRNA hydrolase [Pelolinea sp.]